MKIKAFIYVMLCICVAFAISGCGKKNTKLPDDAPGINTSGIQNTLLVTPTGSENPTIAPLENHEITIYTLNSDTLEKEAITILVMVEDELTPDLIVEQVVEAMEDEGFYIGINKTVVKDDGVRIDFKSDAAPVVDVGASVEGSIIDILAQSILDNLPQYKKIYISIEDKPYCSGHLEFKLDDVYLGR